MNNSWARAGLVLLLAGCAGGAGTSLPPVHGTAGSGSDSLVPAALVRQAVPSGWAATNTQSLAGLKASSDLGAMPATQKVSVAVGLALRKPQALKLLVRQQNTVGSGQHNAFLTPQQVLDEYGPTAAQAGAVANYLRTKGFTNIAVEPNRLYVTATGTAAQTEKAFHTSLHRMRFKGINGYANVSAAFVPQSLGGTVLAVLGLNNVLRMSSPKIQKCTAGSGSTCVRFYDPATFKRAYDVGSTLTGSKATLAVMAEGDPTIAISWWHENQTKDGLPPIGITRIQVGIPSPDTAGNDEWALDMTYSQGMAETFKHMYIYTTTSMTDQDIALEYNKWVSQDRAQIGNSSFGICEVFPYLDGSMVMDDEALLQGAAQGQTMFVSTGDSGGFCSVGVPNGVPAGAPFVEYPATSPYAVAVGGTDLFSHTDGSYQGEQTWEAGGGGLSQFEYAPYWDAWAQPVAGNGESFRGTPDIAYDASLETGALLWEGGTQYITGGTSLASPMAAGTWARYLSCLVKRLGFAPPRLYAVYKNNYVSTPPVPPTNTGPLPTDLIGGYHDILAGSNANPADTATYGYDYGTGLGTFDIWREWQELVKT
jgi:pseudomonalisin